MSDAPLYLRSCRISPPERLSDRLLDAALLSPAGGRDLRAAPVLFSLIEVSRPWFAESVLLPGIRGTLEEEAAKLEIGKPLDDQLEAVLNALNLKLGAISETGETDWIGTLSGIVMLVGNGELHFSQSGTCAAYLLQNNRIRQITDEPQEADPSPARTFATLASGTFKENDQVLLGNRELYREISLDALRRTLNGATPYGAATAIAKELARAKNPGAAAHILRAAATATDEPEQVSLEAAMESGLKKAGRRIMPAFGRLRVRAVAVTSAGVNVAMAAKQAAVAVAAPAALEALRRGATALKPKEAAVAAGSPMVELIRSPKKIKEEEMSAVAAAAQARLDEPEEEVPLIAASELALEAGPAKRKLGPISMQAIPGKAAALRLASLLKADPSKTRKLGAGLLAVLLLATVAFAAARRGGAAPSPTDGNAKILQAAEAEMIRAGTAIELKQDVEASKIIESVEKSLMGLKSPIGSASGRFAKLREEIDARSIALTGSVRLAVAEGTYPFAGEQRGFIGGLPYFYGWNGSAGLTRTGKGAPASVGGVTALPTADDGIIAAAATTEPGTAGYVMTKRNGIFRVVPSGKGTLLRQIQPEGDTFRAADTLATYNGSLYLLDGKSGLVWRYVNSGTAYAKGTSIIDANRYDIRGATSLAVDGSIYILRGDGTVNRYSRGAKDDFSLNSQPYLAAKTVQPVQVVTDAAYPSLYILDAGTTAADRSTARVLEFNKSDGKYVRQYIFPADMTRVRWIDVNPKEGKLWALDGGAVREFALTK